MADDGGRAFSVAENGTFRGGSAGSYQGEKNAEPIVFLSEFIGKKVVDTGEATGSLAATRSTGAALHEELISARGTSA